MFHNKKNRKCCFAKKKKKKEKKNTKQNKQTKKQTEDRVLNYKPIFLRSKDVILSVVIFNLK